MNNNQIIIGVAVLIFVVFFVYTAPIIEMMGGAPARFDVDNDGDIDIFDVRTIWSVIPTTDTTYDMDEDGDIDIFDVRACWNNIGEDPEEPNYETVIEWAHNVEWS